MSEEVKENRRNSEEKIAKGEYDVFISYNPEDQEQVKDIAKLLKDNRIAPWLDEWDLQPGKPWQPLRAQQIKNSKAAAVFIGEAGLGSWQKIESEALLNDFAQRGHPAIPVLLKNVVCEPAMSIFWKNLTHVDFRKRDPDPLEQLIWGITGQKPEKKYRPGILIASLGESPVVVSSMYDLLKQREKIDIDRVTILAPEGEEVQDAYELIEDTLAKVVLDYERLGFEDADSWTNACIFLQSLYKLLDNYQKQGEAVYLSLASGRKSMAALMAWIAPFFPCVKGLYHVIDKEGEIFRSVNDIKGKSSVKQHQMMEPDLKKLILVEIPFERGKQINPALISRLRSSSSRDYKKAEAEALIMGQAIFQPGKILQLCITGQATAQFRKIYEENEADAWAVHNGLLQMQQDNILSDYELAAEACLYKERGIGRVSLYYFTGLEAAIRPVFYTRDNPAHPNSSTTPSKQIVVCALEAANADGEYRTLEQISKSPDFSIASPDNALPSVPSPADSVLIVPLGTSPMIATQLYTLLTKQEKHIIHEVILVYPGDTGVNNGAKMIKRAVYKECGVLCSLVLVEDLDDITSGDDCKKYQQILENTIENVKKRYPSNYKIDLALSGGRKGMTAMTIFAAQKHHIPYVYHTLVTDSDTDDLIDKETSCAALSHNKVSPEELHDRLFLRKYEAEGANPYANFTLFRVPVFSPEGWGE